MCIACTCIGTPVIDFYTSKYIKGNQKSVLKGVFAKTRYPTKSMVKQMAQQTGLTELKIYRWFQRNRKNLLKEGGKRTSARSEYKC